MFNLYKMRHYSSSCMMWEFDLKTKAESCGNKTTKISGRMPDMCTYYMTTKQTDK